MSGFTWRSSFSWLALGAVAGSVTYAAHTLGGPLLELTARGGIWLVCASLIGRRAPAARVAGLHAALFLGAMTVLYYLGYVAYKGTAVPTEITVFWLVAAVLAGPCAGVAGYLAKEPDLLGSAATALIVGGLLGEAGVLVQSARFPAETWAAVAFDVVAACAWLVLTGHDRRWWLRTVAFVPLPLAAGFLLITMFLPAALDAVRPGTPQSSDDADILDSVTVPERGDRGDLRLLPSVADVRAIVGRDVELHAFPAYDLAYFKGIYARCDEPIRGVVAWVPGKTARLTGFDISSTERRPSRLAEVNSWAIRQKGEPVDPVDASMAAVRRCGGEPRKITVTLPRGGRLPAIVSRAGTARDPMLATFFARRYGEVTLIMQTAQIAGPGVTGPSGQELLLAESVFLRARQLTGG